MRRQLVAVGLSVGALAAATALLRGAGITNPTTAALAYLLLVLFIAAAADLWLAAVASLLATLSFNFFFLPPIGTLQISDPNNWIVLAAFLVVGIMASQLSARARSRAHEAHERRLELNRLFDLTRDVLLTTQRDGAFAAIARHVARRFELETLAICLPSAVEGWDVHNGGAVAAVIEGRELDAAMAGTSGLIEFDAHTRSYGGHRTTESSGPRPLTLTPIRLGTRAIGLLVSGGRPLEPGTRDAVAGVVAIAVERSHFLEERHAAELAAQRAELSSALLASLSHDLRTPLTAIRAAISNIASPGLPEAQRRTQAGVAEEQAARLTRLFDEILDMARIDAGAVTPHREWVTPADVVDAALVHAAASVGARAITVEASADVLIEVDLRLSASALAHLVENAVRYAPAACAITVRGWTDEAGLRLDVRDEGPGLDPGEIEQLFEPFYRGRSTRDNLVGTGMGLAITRGLLAAQGGRVWADNALPNGAVFSIAVPARVRPVPDAE
jgi:two-component system, OmpR family, sensor histidine kinase KdpD